MNLLGADKTSYIKDYEIWEWMNEWMKPLIIQSQERSIWWIKIKWLVHNETENSMIEKMLSVLIVLCKLNIRDSERLYFQ